MKKILFILLLTMSSCSTWLEEDPQTSIQIDNYHGEEAMRSLLVGAYASLKQTFELNSHIGMVGTDEAMAYRSNVFTLPLDSYTANPSLAIVSNAWTRGYQTIQNCNIVIDRTSREDLDLAVQHDIVAQARTLRAYCYFRLVQWFGALPILLNEIDAIDSNMLKIGRADIREVYDVIVADLLYATTEGYLSKQLNGGYVNYWAAKALLGKVYLTMGTSKQRFDWNPSLKENEVLAQYLDLPLTPETYYRQALNCFLEIITDGGFRLADDYADLFSIEASKKMQTGESIWEVVYSSERGYGSEWSKSMGMSGYDGSTWNTSAVAGLRNIMPVPSFWGYFKRGDCRRYYSLSDQKAIPADELTGTEASLGPHQFPDDSLTPFYSFEELCRGAIVVTNGTQSTNYDFPNILGISKYRWGTGDWQQMYQQVMSGFAYDNCPNNFIIMRYADVLLMYVEADMLLNGATPGDLQSTGASQTAMRIINDQLLWRARGGKSEAEMLQTRLNVYGEVYQTPETGGIPQPVPDEEREEYLLDYDETEHPFTFEELIKERARELCFEGHRWSDLVRWGLLEEFYTTRRIAQRPNSLIDPYKYLMPIPLREIEASQNKEGFYKNPGY